MVLTVSAASGALGRLGRPSCVKTTVFSRRAPLKRFWVSVVETNITEALVRPARTTGFIVIVELDRSRILSSTLPREAYFVAQ